MIFDGLSTAIWTGIKGPKRAGIDQHGSVSREMRLVLCLVLVLFDAWGYYVHRWALSVRVFLPANGNISLEHSTRHSNMTVSCEPLRDEVSSRLWLANCQCRPIHADLPHHQRLCHVIGCNASILFALPTFLAVLAFLLQSLPCESSDWIRAVALYPFHSLVILCMTLWLYGCMAI